MHCLNLNPLIKDNLLGETKASCYMRHVVTHNIPFN